MTGDKLAQNFYQISSSPIPATSSTTTNIEPAGTASPSSLALLDNILLNVNWFLILFSVLGSLILISNFYFYYRYESDKNKKREQKGEISIWLALNIWLRYIPVVLFIGLYNFTSGIVNFIVFALFCISCVVKIYFDILGLLKNQDYFPWFSTLSTNISNLLKLRTKK
jgi:Na+/H+ antiporter NhaC